MAENGNIQITTISPSRFVHSWRHRYLLLLLPLSQLVLGCHAFLHAFLTPSFVNSAHDSSNHHIVVPCSNDIFLRMRWFNFDSMYTHYWSNTKVLLATSSSSSVTTEDSLEEIQSIASWKSSSPTAKEAAIIYRAQSILDQNAHLEVKKRIGGAGWHTVGIVGGPTKSIYHGVFRKDEVTGKVDPYALGPSEYIRTMASVALCLSAVCGTSMYSNTNSTSESNTTIPLRFLHMGYGAGSLMRFLGKAIPESKHVAIDLDPTVVDAAVQLDLLDAQCEQLVVGDALEYSLLSSLPSSSLSLSSPRFHGVCIDVFDGSNLMPPGFYSVPFLEKIYKDLLQQQQESGDSDNCTFVIHNFHIGTERLAVQLKDAMASYRAVFGSGANASYCCNDDDHNDDNGEDPNDEHSNHDNEQQTGQSRVQHLLYKVDSLNTNNHGGNTILIAILQNTQNNKNTNAQTKTLSLLELAALARERWGFERFNVASRITNAQPF